MSAQPEHDHTAADEDAGQAAPQANRQHDSQPPADDAMAEVVAPREPVEFSRGDESPPVKSQDTPAEPDGSRQNVGVRNGAPPGGPPRNTARQSAAGTPPPRTSQPSATRPGSVPTSTGPRPAPSGGTAPKTQAAARLPGTAATQSKSSGRRRAHLILSRVEPWSVMKFSFVISLVAFIVLFVAVAVLYGILDGLGVFSTISSTIKDVTSSGQAGGVDPSGWFAVSRVLGYAGLVGALNVILITALSTIGAVLYNLAADLVGGIEVTLGEGQ